MSASRRVADVLFRLLIPAGGLFVITVLSLVMLPFSSTEAPLARFLDTRGGFLIAMEVAALGVIGLGALVADRAATLAEPPEERGAGAISDAAEAEAAGEATTRAGGTAGDAPRATTAGINEEHE